MLNARHQQLLGQCHERAHGLLRHLYPVGVEEVQQLVPHTQRQVQLQLDALGRLFAEIGRQRLVEEVGPVSQQDAVQQVLVPRVIYDASAKEWQKR